MGHSVPCLGSFGKVACKLLRTPDKLNSRRLMNFLAFQTRPKNSDARPGERGLRRKPVGADTAGSGLPDASTWHRGSEYTVHINTLPITPALPQTCVNQFAMAKATYSNYASESGSLVIFGAHATTDNTASSWWNDPGLRKNVFFW